MARGRQVAYLGRDDVRRPDHLRSLVSAISAANADLASSLVEMIGPRGSNFRVVSGIYPPGGYDGKRGLCPSGLMHSLAIARQVGGWKDYRTIARNPDTQFAYDGFLAGSRFASTSELTVVKFNSALRKGSLCREAEPRTGTIPEGTGGSPGSCCGRPWTLFMCTGAGCR